jgi:predicted negative regulator of RcsB-dependent stress response
MTTPEIDSTAPVRQPKAESFLDWFHINSRWVGIGAAAVLVAGAIAWYIPRARIQKNENADKQLLAAKQSINSGNEPLAESDLKKVVDRYAGTPSGTEAGLLLAQLRLTKGDAGGAVTVLKDLAGKAGSGPSAATVHGLLGDALSQANQTAEAAAEYARAAALTSMPNERTLLLTKAGHAYMAAGRREEARKVWESVAAQQENPQLAAEARLRLGELLAATARKG